MAKTSKRRRATKTVKRPAARKRAPKLNAAAAKASAALTIVGVGASAGGLEAFTQLVETVPGDAGLVLILVQHIAPHLDSALPHLLSAHAQMPVVQVTDGARLRANHIYVIPPNAQLAIDGDTFVVTPRADGGRHTPIDTLFTSLAAAAGRRAIAVVLSGTASDGTAGIREIKGAGGIAIAQKPESARYDGMPRSAIATGLVDLILTPQEIGPELARMATQPYGRSAVRADDRAITDEHLRRLLDVLRTTSGADFRNYKQPTIRRRLMRRMALNRLSDADAYLALLRGNTNEARALYRDLLIHVTRFFREPQSFEALTKEVFPKLVAGPHSDRPLRFWVCGCATGEEAYSLAMTAVEFFESRDENVNVHIFATDISDHALERARSGVYPDSIAPDVGPARLRRFFTRVDGQYRVSKQIRDLCVFAKHDLTRDPPFSRLDLIMCRNVLIYMDAELQRRLIGLLHYALNPHGYLVLGQAETVGGQASLFSLLHKKMRVHQKKTASAAVPGIPFNMDTLPAVARHKRASDHVPEKGLDSAASRFMLDRYAPSGVVVDVDGQIVQFRGQTGDYLEPAAGEASLNLLKMAREGMLHGLRGALQAARNSTTPVRREGIQVRVRGKWEYVDIEVVPLTASGRPYFLVLFEKPKAAAGKRGVRAAKGKKAAAPSPKSLELQRELAANRDYMQSIIQELEAANEELQSANEEILSSNEELQSTNEELDTAKEELQSTNEELNTVNDELHARNEEISRVNSDLVNLLGSVQIAIVIVNTELRIRRFTPMAEKILNLIPADLDRSIAHINTNLECPDLEKLIVDCIDSVAPVEREVQDRQGRWYSLRIRPYKSVDNKIDGAVLALFEIDQLKRSEQRAQLAHSLATTAIMEMDQPAALLESDLRVRVANPSFARIFDRVPGDLPHRSLVDLGGRAWRLEAWQQGGREPGATLPNETIAPAGKPAMAASGTVVQDPENPAHVLIMMRIVIQGA